MTRVGEAVRAFIALTWIEARAAIRIENMKFPIFAAATCAFVSAAALGPQMGLYGQASDGDFSDPRGILNGRSFLDPAERSELDIFVDAAPSALLAQSREGVFADKASIDFSEAALAAFEKGDTQSISTAAERLTQKTASSAMRAPDAIGVKGSMPPALLRLLSSEDRAKIVPLGQDDSRSFMSRRAAGSSGIALVAFFHPESDLRDGKLADIFVQKPEGLDSAAYFGVRAWAAKWMADGIQAMRADDLRLRGLSLEEVEPAPFKVSISKAEGAFPRITLSELSSRVAMLALFIVSLSCALLTALVVPLGWIGRYDDGSCSAHAKSPLASGALCLSFCMGMCFSILAPVATGILGAWIFSSAFGGGLSFFLALKGIAACMASVVLFSTAQSLAFLFFSHPTARIVALTVCLLVSTIALYGGISWALSQDAGSKPMGGWLAGIISGNMVHSAACAAALAVVSAALAAVIHFRVGRFERRPLGAKL